MNMALILYEIKCLTCGASSGESGFRLYAILWPWWHALRSPKCRREVRVWRRRSEQVNGKVCAECGTTNPESGWAPDGIDGESMCQACDFSNATDFEPTGDGER